MWKTTLFSVSIYLCLIFCAAFCGDSERIICERLIKAVKQTAVLNTDSNIKDLKAPEDLYLELEKISKETSIADIDEILLYYLATCEIKLGNKEKAEAIIADGIKKNIDIPDLMILEINLIGDSREGSESRIKVWDELGRILPLSIYGRDRDNRYGEPRIKSNPPLPKIPKTSRPESIEKIGKIFEGMGFLRQAIDSYLESIYMGGLDEINKGKLWLKVGNLEYLMAEKKLAVRAYIRALYTSPQLDVPVAEGLMKCFALKDDFKKETIIMTPDAKKIVEIAELYRELNIHPLAMKLFADVKDIIDADFSKEKEQLNSEWGKLLEKMIYVVGPNCHIYGQDISKVQDWSKVKIPRPSDTFWQPSRK